MLFGISASDPATLAAVALCLAAVAIAAGYIPARRAIRIDPLVALRHE
jgi:putative ABC transport system permease protein